MQYNKKRFTRHLNAIKKQLQQYIEKDAPRIIGTETVNFFRDSFDKGGFTDTTFNKWKQSKRRDEDSKWYGFQYRARTPLPDNHPRRKNTKKKYKPRKSNPITNFSPAATKRPTLIGKTGDLKESLSYKLEGKKIIIESDQDYAEVHNEGGKIQIFGGKTVQLPQRKFMGESEKLDTIIEHEIDKDIDNILNH